MKIELIVEGRTGNPNYNRHEPVSESNPFDVAAPVGTVIEHKDAWLHCLPDHLGVVRAKPVDEEAVTKVNRMLARRGRILEDR